MNHLPFISRLKHGTSIYIFEYFAVWSRQHLQAANMDVAYKQHSSHARRKNRSNTNLNHLSLAPLTTKMPLTDTEYLPSALRLRSIIIHPTSRESLPQQLLDFSNPPLKRDPTHLAADERRLPTPTVLQSPSPKASRQHSFMCIRRAVMP